MYKIYINLHIKEFDVCYNYCKFRKNVNIYLCDTAPELC